MTNETKQTAVELLKSSIQVSIESLSGELNEYQAGYKQCLIDMRNEIDSKFLEMEKEQIIEALLFGDVLSLNTAETYYKETYGGNK